MHSIDDFLSNYEHTSYQLLTGNTPQFSPQAVIHRSFNHLHEAYANDTKIEDISIYT